MSTGDMAGADGTDTTGDPLSIQRNHGARVRCPWNSAEVDIHSAEIIVRNVPAGTFPWADFTTSRRSPRPRGDVTTSLCRRLLPRICIVVVDPLDHLGDRVDHVIEPERHIRVPARHNARGALIGVPDRGQGR